MKRNLRKEISAIEIEEILADYFNAFDVLLKIVDTKDFDFGETSYTEYYGSGSTTHPAI